MRREKRVRAFYYSKLYIDGKKMVVIVLAVPHTQSIDYFHIYLLSARSFLFTAFAFNYNPNLEAVASSRRLNANFMLIWQDNKLELVKYTCREHDAGRFTVTNNMAHNAICCGWCVQYWCERARIQLSAIVCSSASRLSVVSLFAGSGNQQIFSVGFQEFTRP